MNNEQGVECCWEMDEQDLENIKNNGGKVYLYIQGSAVPPVLLTTESAVLFTHTADMYASKVKDV